MNKPIHLTEVELPLPSDSRVRAILKEFKADRVYEVPLPIEFDCDSEAFDILQCAGSDFRLRDYRGPIDKKQAGQVDGIIVENYHRRPHNRAELLYAGLTQFRNVKEYVESKHAKGKTATQQSLEEQASFLAQLDTSIHAIEAELSFICQQPCAYAQNAAGFIKLLLTSGGFLSTRDVLFVESGGIAQTATLDSLQPYDHEGIEYTIDGNDVRGIGSHPLLHYLAPSLTQHSLKEHALESASVYTLGPKLHPRLCELIDITQKPGYELTESEYYEINTHSVGRAYGLLETARNLYDEGGHKKYCIVVGKLDVHAWLSPENGSTFFDQYFGDDAVLVLSPTIKEE